MSTAGAAVVWCPFPDIESARDLSAHLLGEKLIACANIIPAVKSLFMWQGECSRVIECAVLFKTTAERLNRVVERLGERHPYDMPAIIGWHCDAGHPRTLEWLSGLLEDDRAGEPPES